MPIRALLEWAFAAECAQLDLPDRRPPDARGFGLGMEAILLEQAQLGVRVDTSRGRSLPHDDAEIIAGAVAALAAEPRFGAGMAIRVAELARVRAAPDWMRNAAPRCVPVAWQAENQYGPRARTEVVETVEVMTRRGRRRRDVLACPVTYVPTAAQIGAARRGYLEWWDALLHLQVALRGQLFRHEVTPDMPPLAPWRAGD